MAGFFIPDPRFEMPSLLEPGRKPVGPVDIDESKSQNLINYWLFGGQSGMRDLVSGAIAEVIIDANIFADYVETTGLTGRYINLPLSVTDISNPITIVIDYEYVSGSVEFSLLDRSGSSWTGYYIENGTVKTSNSNSFDGELTPVAAQPVGALAFTMHGANDLRACRNGGAVITDTSCQSPSGTQANISLGGAVRSAPDNPSIARFKSVAVFNRGFSSAELKSISADPYKDFIPA
jgi:hypothetical protein